MRSRLGHRHQQPAAQQQQQVKPTPRRRQQQPQQPPSSPRNGRASTTTASPTNGAGVRSEHDRYMDEAKKFLMMSVLDEDNKSRMIFTYPCIPRQTLLVIVLFLLCAVVHVMFEQLSEATTKQAPVVDNNAAETKPQPMVTPPAIAEPQPSPQQPPPQVAAAAAAAAAEPQQQQAPLPPPKPPGSPYAYAFVLSNCTDAPDDSCLGPILNLVVSAYTLRGSSTDRVLYVHMSPQTTATRLFSTYEQWILRLNYTLHYVPPANPTVPAAVVDVSAAHVLERFRVLEMTDYQRVMFFDPRRVLPLCNMEYILAASDAGSFQGTVLLSAMHAPILSSLFVVTPREGEFANIMDIVRQYRERHPSEETRPPFDKSKGWGQPLSKKDLWKAWRNKGNLWNFADADRDPGLLYHWARYVHMNYTRMTRSQFISWSEIQAAEKSDWSKRTKGEVFSSTQPRFVRNTTATRYIARIGIKEYKRGFGCGGPMAGRDRRSSYLAPYRDFLNFDTHGTPWLSPIKAVDKSAIPSYRHAGTPSDLWRLALMTANATWDLGLPSSIAISPEANNPKSSTRANILSTHVPLPQPMSVLLQRAAAAGTKQQDGAVPSPPAFPTNPGFPNGTLTNHSGLSYFDADLSPFELR